MGRVEEDAERRGGTDIELHGPVVATLTVRIADDEAEFDATVVKASARTVIRADARPGRRIEDVPDSRQLELVILDESLDLRELL
jgi:hypothetical protein